MGSQFAPDLRRLDSNYVPEIPTVRLVRVNGLLRYKLLPGGWVWKRYFAFDEPPADDAEYAAGKKRPCLEVIYSVDEQLAMRTFVQNAVADAEPWH